MSEKEAVITMDVDLELDSELPVEEPLTVLPSTTDPNSNLIEASSEVPNDEIKQSGPQARPDTVHLHGVDDMSTKDIEAYFAEYQPSKIEWVNDTSCNAVFSSDEQALQAIQGLLLEPNASINHTILRKSKVFTNASGTSVNHLHIRLASDFDVKERGARERSRYYLLHGEPSKDINSRLGKRKIEKRMKEAEKDDVLSRLGGYKEPGSRRSRRHVRNHR